MRSGPRENCPSMQWNVHFESNDFRQAFSVCISVIKTTVTSPLSFKHTHASRTRWLVDKRTQTNFLPVHLHSLVQLWPSVTFGDGLRCLDWHTIWCLDQWSAAVWVEVDKCLPSAAHLVDFQAATRPCPNFLPCRRLSLLAAGDLPVEPCGFDLLLPW